MKTITITEFDSIAAERHGSNQILFSQKVQWVPVKAFDALKSTFLQTGSTGGEMLDFMQLSFRKGIGEVITVKNYVGLIAAKDGTVLEILPKIAKNQDSDVKIKQVRRLLLTMLKTLKNSTPFRHIQTAQLDTAKMPLLEIFIRMFIDEVSALAKRGLRGGYQTVQQNGYTFKGRMRVQEHIRKNCAHKERCFVEYDSFECNRAENRIIKSTLLLLSRMTSSLRNKSDLNKLLFIFDEIEASHNLEADFQAISSQRDRKEYETILRWSRLFLKKESFTPFSGNGIAFALLFPMETLFESYIASLCRTHIRNHHPDYKLSIQDRTYTLFDEPKEFQIRPDIVLSFPNGRPPIVMDTKWKMVSPGSSNSGISQADMYQMYVYHKKYHAQKVIVIYPERDAPLDPQEMRPPQEMRTKDGVCVEILCIDILKSPEAIAKQLLSGVLVPLYS